MKMLNVIINTPSIRSGKNFIGQVMTLIRSGKILFENFTY